MRGLIKRLIVFRAYTENSSDHLNRLGAPRTLTDDGSADTEEERRGRQRLRLPRLPGLPPRLLRGGQAHAAELFVPPVLQARGSALAQLFEAGDRGRAQPRCGFDCTLRGGARARRRRRGVL